MRNVTLTAFIDELSKISSNMAAPPSEKSGMGGNVMVPSTPRVGIPKQEKNPAAKPTNYSIVHSESPGAGQNMASSKVAPPPPVRT